jgi:pimeloyl-ACP methyl ester carboxylesterase
MKLGRDDLLIIVKKTMSRHRWPQNGNSMRKPLFLLLLLTLASFANAEFASDYIVEHPLKIALVNNIEIAYREIGKPENPKVLMIMGLGASNRVHGDNMVRGIEQAGFQVLIYDNRDTGGSTRFDSWGQPTIWWQLLKDQLGFTVNAPYTLDDMSADAAGLLDAVGYQNAHVIGFSMGGMIAQQVAAQYPQRVRSLTSVMSTTFAKHLPPPTKEARERLTNFASGEAAKQLSQAMRDRGFYPESMPRQLMAIFKTGDRSDEVKTIAVKTLVIHGEDDGLVLPSHGEHTAELIQNSEIVIFPGMGHNVPEDILPSMLERMISHMKTADFAVGTTESHH